MIVIPKGHPENLDGDHSFLDWTRDASLQEPPNAGREDGRIRITAALAALDKAVADYTAAVARDHDHPEERVRLNVRNAVRRHPALAAILLQEGKGGDVV
jgi:hypothetical protein